VTLQEWTDANGYSALSDELLRHCGAALKAGPSPSSPIKKWEADEAFTTWLRTSYLARRPLGHILYLHEAWHHVVKHSATS